MILKIPVLLFLLHSVQAAISFRAVTLDFSSTWFAPIPNNVRNSASKYILENWHTHRNEMYGTHDISFAQDPITKNETVLKIIYPKNSYAPVGAKNGTAGGVEFYSVPNNGEMYDTALLSYDLLFDPSFKWVKGGKLPGIFGGSPGRGCSGGDKANGKNCFSIRLMWRARGDGEVYAYIPESDTLCQTPNVFCNRKYGTSFSRGVIQFHTNKWTNIEIYVKLNSGSDMNGVLKVWQDGSLMIHQENLQFRTNPSLGISSLMFSTFFGGGSSSYATPVNTSTYYKNIQFSVGNTTLNLDPVSSGNRLIILSTLYITTAITLLLLSL